MARKGIVERGFFARSTRVLPARTLPARPSAQVSAPAVSLAGPWCTDYEQQLAGHAWAAAPHASPADRSAAADAGALAAARARAAAPSGDGEEPVNEAGSAAARMTAQCADAVSRQGDRPGTVAPADWTAFGVVVPVLSASPGSGASVAAMAIADAAQLAGLSVLVVDTADPARSGLNRATVSDGPQVRGPHPAVRLRFSWRAQALVARAETTLPVLTPGMLPPPPFWQPGQRRIDITVVDIGHDPWRVSAHPLAGAGAWLRPGTPSPRPILVVRPSIPALVHAEQVLARLEPWVALGAADAPGRLVVAGARHWPREVPGTAGHRLQPLVANAVFLPHDADLAVRGITAALTPTRLRTPLRNLVQSWTITPRPDVFARDPPRRRRRDRRERRITADHPTRDRPDDTMPRGAPRE